MEHFIFTPPSSERFRLLNLFFFTTTFVPLKRRDGVLEWTSGSRLGLDLPMKIILYFNFSLLNPRCTPGRVLSGIIGERDKGLRLLVQMPISLPSRFFETRRRLPARLQTKFQISTIFTVLPSRFFETRRRLPAPFGTKPN